MALILNKDSNYGVSGNYWKITTTSINYLDETVSAILYLYRDEESRRSGKAPLDCLKVVLNLSDINPNSDIRVSLYNYIKGIDIMSEAVDG